MKTPRRRKEDGARVLILDEKSPGGRARTDEMDGFRFNRGPHAVYVGGAGRRVLNRGVGLPRDFLRGQVDRDRDLNGLRDRMLRLLFSDGKAGDAGFSAQRWTGVLAPVASKLAASRAV